LFEPEHEYQTQEGHLICDKYISEDNATEIQIEYFNNIFSNKIDNDWIAQISNRWLKMHLWSWIPKLYVTKFVRCNLSAHFLNAHFNIPVLYIVRNPYDVIQSQNRVKFSWLYNLNHFKFQKDLNEVLKTEHNFNWEEIKTYSEIEILTLRWCLENKVMFDLNSTKSDTFKILKQEDLKADINIFYDLCKTFNLKPLSSLQETYNKPSSKTHPKSEIIKKANNTNGLEPKQINAITNILNRFKVTDYTLHNQN
jgi:hypothetical protein